MRFPSAWVLVAILSLLAPLGFSPSSALAQTPDPEARATFERGVAAYEAGAFEDALTAFQEAYRLTNDAQILYNVATVADRLRRDALALEAYEGYLAGYPAAPDRLNVEARIAALRSVIAASSVPDETLEEPNAITETVPIEEPLEERVGIDDASRRAAARQSEAGLVLTITGAVLAVGGAALLIASAVEIDAAHRAETWAEFMGPSERAPLLSAVGWISMGLGAAMAALGVGWLVLGSSSQVALRVGPTQLSLEGTF